MPPCPAIARRSPSIGPRLVLAAIAVHLACAPALADEARLGAATLSYDADRWLVETSPKGLRFVSRRGDRAIVTAWRRTTVEAPDCASAVALPEHYREARTRPTTLDGRPATRIEAASGCRNAVSRAVGFCVEAGAWRYVVASLAPSCRDAAPFAPSADSAAEIAGGLRLSP